MNFSTWKSRLGKYNGKGTIVEVYPAASLAAFNKGVGGNRKFLTKTKENRHKLLQVLAEHFGIHDPQNLLKGLRGSNDADSHLTDAFLAALTGLVYFETVAGVRKGLTPGSGDTWTVRCPKEEEKKLAAIEGWIFFPICNQ